MINSSYDFENLLNVFEIMQYLKEKSKKMFGNNF